MGLVENMVPFILGVIVTIVTIAGVYAHQEPNDRLEYIFACTTGVVLLPFGYMGLWLLNGQAPPVNTWQSAWFAAPSGTVAILALILYLLTRRNGPAT
jgi:Mg2+ and Co2+ transporter CorA